MPSKYKLTYFDGWGAAEHIRQIFAYANQDYEDVRMQQTDWPAIKPTTPFGKVPILEIDGKQVGQSISIARYLGKQFGLAGNDDWESLQCDVMVDTLKDLVDGLLKVYFEKDPEKIQEIKKQFLEKDLPFYFEKFNKIVADNAAGVLVGSQVTWADIYFASNLDVFERAKPELLKPYPNLEKLVRKVQSNPGIKAWYEKRSPNPWPALF